MTGDQHQPGQATASQAWAAYMAKRAGVDAAREISTDLGTDEGLNAYLLEVEADAAYGDYADAWWRENCTQAETSDPEPEIEEEQELCAKGIAYVTEIAVTPEPRELQVMHSPMPGPELGEPEA